MYGYTEAAAGSESIVLRFFGNERPMSGISDSQPQGLDELPFHTLFESCCGSNLKRPARDTIEVDTSPLTDASPVSDLSVCEPVNAAGVFYNEIRKNAGTGRTTASTDGYYNDSGGRAQDQGGYNPTHGAPHPAQQQGEFRPHPQDGGYNQYQGGYSPTHGAPNPAQQQGEFRPHPQDGGYNQYQGGYSPTHGAPNPAQQHGGHSSDETLYAQNSSPSNNLNSPQYTDQVDRQRKIRPSEVLVGPQPERSMGPTQKPTNQYQTYANADLGPCCNKPKQQQVLEQHQHQPDNRSGPKSDASSFFDPRDVGVQLLPPLPLFPIRESAASYAQFESDRATLPAYGHVGSTYQPHGVNMYTGHSSDSAFGSKSSSGHSSQRPPVSAQGAGDYALRSPMNADQGGVYTLGGTRGYTSPLDEREDYY